MARTKQQIAETVTDLCKEKGLSEADTKIVVAFATQDAAALEGVSVTQLLKAAEIVDFAVARQSDYSRAMNEAKAEKDKATAHMNNLKKWREEEVLPQLRNATEKVKRYEAKVGKLEDLEADDERPVSGKGKGKGDDDVETVDISTVKGEMARDFLSFEQERSALDQRFFDYFKRPLDTRPLIKLIADAASEPQPRVLSLTDAFNEVHGPKIKEIDDAARQNELKAAEERGKEAGRREAMAAGASRTGAAVPANAGAFWDHISRDAAKDAAFDPAANAAAFAADLRRETERVNKDFETAITS